MRKKIKKPVEIPAVNLQRMVKRHTAWSLAADWWWLDKYAPRIVGGRKLWEVATIPERGNQKRVRLWRLEGLKEYTRWVKPETRMELVPLTMRVSYGCPTVTPERKQNDGTINAD